jgi:DNA-directed RNA polymerase beta subunit
MTSNCETNECNDSETPWIFIESYFKQKHLKQLVKHQLESYNYFVNNQIQNTIEMFNPLLISSDHDYIKELNMHRLEIEINFENLCIYRPQIYENNGSTKIMFPQEARLRNFSYSSSMTIDLDIKYCVRNGENFKNVLNFQKKIKNIHIGKIPIMLKSDLCVLNQYKHLDHNETGECYMDPGGYFIINGSEKTCIGQERAAENQIYCHNIEKNNNKWSWMAEMKCIPDWKCISPKQITIFMASKNNGFGFPLYLQIPRIKIPIPLFVIFRALGIISDKEICELIVLNIENAAMKKMLEALRGSIIDANKYMTQECAIKHIVNNVIYTPMNMDKETGSKKKYNFAMDVLNNDIFPHCKTEKQKIYMLGYMTNILIQASFGWLEEDDRDSYINKRIDLTGSLLNNLLRNYFNKLVKDMKKQIIREINNGSWKSTDDYENIITKTNIYKIIKSTTIENGIKRALATGDFGIKQVNSNKVGVAQVLNRLTYISSLSHLRRINTPIDKSGKLVPPRRLHNSTWGFLCPAETPEGQSIGIVKNLAYLAHITINSNSSGLYEYILPIIESIDNYSGTYKELYDYVKVFINGTWVGITKDPKQVIANLKEKKYKGIINIYISIIFNSKLKEIRVCNDAGRICRPLLKIKNNKPIYDSAIVKRVQCGELSWDDLLISIKLEDSIIEYVDSYEQNNALIAMRISDLTSETTNNNNAIHHYSHCEIHPSTIFGILASCIPFPDSNQSPRNTYQCLDVNTPVLMKDNTYKLIKDINVYDCVQTFDPKTMKTTYTKIINQYVRITEKQMYNITTYSGKSFNATFDHKFMTYNGWKEVHEMLVYDDLIGIKPDVKEVSSIHNSKELIYDSKKFKSSLLSLRVNESLCTKYINILTKLGLMPLYNNNNKVPILAKIVGYALTNGKLAYDDYNNTFTIMLTFKSICDLDIFELDVEELGFAKSKSAKNNCQQNNDYETNKPINVYYKGAFACLLQVLGLNDTLVYYDTIPQWIKDGSDLVKREFLAGLQGGCGGIIAYKNEKDCVKYYCEPLLFNKTCLLKQNLNKIISAISQLFSYFGISNTLFYKKQGITEQLNNNVYLEDYDEFGLQINNEETNLIRTNSLIGYKYDNYKNTRSALVIEYLNYKQSVYYDKKISIDLFVEKCKIINDALFIPLMTKTKIDNVLISDITTQSENHSFFIKGGFMTHNSAMGKQAIGVYVTNYDNRMDKTAYVLTYPMRPLVETRVMNIIKLNNIPSGQQVIVAIASHSGYNQEDSLLFNKGSIDRGLFLATIYHTEKDEDKKLFGNEEIRCKPDKSNTKNMKFANYDKLDSKGIVKENTLIEDRDIIIGKVLPIKENKNDFTKTMKHSDESISFRTHEESYVDKNYIETNGDGYNFCKVRIRNYRKPVIGDKFSSRHGQKGTIGNIIPEEDMPFTADGLKPDIIINPHAIPSRMTIAQLKETLLGKVLLQLGLFGDGTSFGEFEISSIINKLNDLGYESKGNELMYNALTGEQLTMSIFIGPAFYQRLKHMVNDKQHSRSIGPMVNLTRQPAEGRARDGGLRFGEMERDCMISHGASRFTKGRIFDASDAYSTFACAKCGSIAAFNNKEHIHYCNMCSNRSDFKYIEIPYACKLMFQELLTMNIAPRILCE